MGGDKRLKGLILAGGNGLRMKPFSMYTAKQLLPILNKPVLFHNIELLLSAGIRDIGIVVGPMKKYVVAEIRDSKYMEIANICFIDQPEPSGLAHAVLLSRTFLEDDDFVMLLGDNLFTAELSEIVSLYRASSAESIATLTHVTEPSRYGIAIVEEDNIICVQEKPEIPSSNWALAGLYIFRPTIHEIIGNLEPSGRNEYEITDAIQKQIDKGRQVKPWFLEGYWRDIGTLKDLLETNIDILNINDQSKKNEASSHRTIFSTLSPPVLIHKTAVVLNSVIGPNVIIGPNAFVKNSRIKDSLVLENSVVENQTRRRIIFSPWGDEEVRMDD